MTNLSLWWVRIYGPCVSRAGKGQAAELWRSLVGELSCSRELSKSGRQQRGFGSHPSQGWWRDVVWEGPWEGAEATHWVRPFRGAAGDGRWEPSDSMDDFFSSLVEAVGEQLYLLSLI